MNDIEMLIHGDVFCAQMSPDGDGVWNVFFARARIGDEYVGSIMLKDGRIIEAIQADDSIMDADVWDDVLEEFQTKILEAADAEYEELEAREDIPVIEPPMPKYCEAFGFSVEGMESCMDSTDFVLATSMDDPMVLLARILHNQKTIMAYIAKDYE